MKKVRQHQTPWKLAGILNSFKSAFRGVKILFHIKNIERNLFIQSSIAIFVIFLGFLFGIGHIEWMILVLSIGLVIFAELMNTAVERIMDFVHKDYHEDVRDIKDLAAGAVVFTVIISLVVGGVIFIPHISSLFFG